MNEFEILQMAIDLATKHGRHNQKAHGRRFGSGGGVSGGALRAAEKETEARLRALPGREASRQIPFELNAARVSLQRHEDAVDNFNSATRLARRRADSAPDEATRKRAHAEIDAVEQAAQAHLQKNKRLIDETRRNHDAANKELREIEKDVDRMEKHYQQGPDDNIIRRTARAESRYQFIKDSEKEVNNFVRRMMETADV